MHPFGLNDKELDLVAGGGKFTSLIFGEEGGAKFVQPDPTTMALGEEGGGEPVPPPAPEA